MLRQILDAVTQMAERVETIEQSVGDLRLAKPPPMPLGPSEVASVIRTRPMVRFQVLEDYRHAGNTLKRGREIQANHYPRLLDFVQDGLKLAVSQQRAEPPRPAAAVS